MVEAGFPISMAAAFLTLFLVGVAEWLHLRRVARVKTLAFGPSGRPSHWARLTPLVRTLACAAVSWALSVLLFVTPRVHDANVVQPEDYRHVVLVLDVSPSMRLQDGGPERDQSRMQRASDVMESFFKRVAIQQYKMSVVAVYSSAKPVVVETNDVDVVRNILNDLPMHYAFPVGKTDLFSGLNEAAALSKGWQPRSTTVIVISDGDTVPATGMPTMPASVSNVVVVGIGDPITGQFIDGRQSRQDAATLRQIAVRLGGVYHNGNANHLSSDLLNQLTSAEEKSVWEALGIREYALVVLTLGAATLLFLPLLLFYFGASPAWTRSVLGRGAARSLGTEG